MDSSEMGIKRIVVVVKTGETPKYRLYSGEKHLELFNYKWTEFTHVHAFDSLYTEQRSDQHSALTHCFGLNMFAALPLESLVGQEVIEQSFLAQPSAASVLWTTVDSWKLLTFYNLENTIIPSIHSLY